jgi:hypothetical protein
MMYSTSILHLSTQSEGKEVPLTYSHNLNPCLVFLCGGKDAEYLQNISFSC